MTNDNRLVYELKTCMQSKLALRRVHSLQWVGHNHACDVLLKCTISVKGVITAPLAFHDQSFVLHQMVIW